MKQLRSILLCVMAAIMCMALCSCGASVQTAAPEAEPSPLPELGSVPIQVQETVPTRVEHDFDILGMIINDDGRDSTYMTLYGFLHTAENLGYPAKVFRVKTAAEADEAVENAYLDGISALVVYDPDGVYENAMALAREKGMEVAVPYYACDSDDVSANVVVDDTDYYDELARGIAERMTERSLKSGRILVYGRNTEECRAAFASSIAEAYPQFTVTALERRAVGDDLATDELAQYILNNRDIKGMYVVDSDASNIAVDARSRAQTMFRAGLPTPTPTQKPTPTPEPDATSAPVPASTSIPAPTPTPNPALLKTIAITLFCSGLSSDNYDLFNDNDIYALCIEPYYEASAQATMMLDKILSGDGAAKLSRVNRPIVYNETADKYKAIYEQMRYMFGLE